jgi:hypothetical protein
VGWIWKGGRIPAPFSRPYVNVKPEVIGVIEIVERALFFVQAKDSLFKITPSVRI